MTQDCRQGVGPVPVAERQVCVTDPGAGDLHDDLAAAWCLELE